METRAGVRQTGRSRRRDGTAGGELKGPYPRCQRSAASPGRGGSPSPCPARPPWNEEGITRRDEAADGSINATTTAVHGLTSDLPDDVPHEEEEGVLR